MVLADEPHIAVTRKTSPFSVMLDNLHSIIQGPVIDFPKFDIVLGLDWFLLCSEAQHRHTTGNPNLRIGFMAGKAIQLPCCPE
ncbi:hypothetical protein DSO57_1026258 [Entomophthora muscae]|uniref:Uncharacterized protein n=1 Tax=Entomophthora muscae TaxID=34485 RepID=A0ACC2RH45_9FUNG|nr:hypothetical protein DSO57_1026258 [Entomophthora muscae]